MQSNSKMASLSQSDVKEDNKRDTVANHRKALLFINISSLLQSIATSMLKYLTTVPPSSEFNLVMTPLDALFLRSIFLSTLSFIVACSRNELKEIVSVPTSHPSRGILLLRCVFGTMSYGTLSLTLVYLPVSVAMILVNTTPFWVAILSFIFLSDRIRAFELVCMVGCFSGIFIMTLWRDQGDADTSEEVVALHTKTLIGIFFGITCAITFSLVIVVIKKLQNTSAMVMMFYYGFVSTLTFLVAIVVNWRN
mmetsp:Transcript_13812/g.23558  ORF Transcript_13812/g.23558 Transcript_13812/m.23558 type:complete len:251 (+) Transcript_13812:1-753(+)